MIWKRFHPHRWLVHDTLGDIEMCMSWLPSRAPKAFHYYPYGREGVSYCIEDIEQFALVTGSDTREEAIAVLTS